MALAAPARLRVLAAGLAGLAAALAPLAGAAETYRIDPARSVILLRTERDGPAARLAHDHAVEATRFAGTITYDSAAPESAQVVVDVETADLRVDEPAARRRLGLEGDLSPGQRAEVERAMRGADQLDTARFPTVRFASTRVRREADGRHVVTGELTIRGVAREVTFPAQVALEQGTLVARAVVAFLQSSFGYRPYSTLLGAIRNRDEVTLHAELVAVP